MSYKTRVKTNGWDLKPGDHFVFEGDTDDKAKVVTSIRDYGIELRYVDVRAGMPGYTLLPQDLERLE